jgi:hypothetical protein
VLVGRRPGAMKPAGSPVAWAGLETAVRVPAPGARFAAVVALNRAGHSLARSRTVPTREIAPAAR